MESLGEPGGGVDFHLYESELINGPKSDVKHLDINEHMSKCVTRLTLTYGSRIATYLKSMAYCLT